MTILLRKHGDGELSEIIVKGVWHVSYFVDDTEDETSEFEGYNLLFLSNGTIKATKRQRNNIRARFLYR